MSREALRFESIRIRRMPGLIDDGFELHELSPGLNIVHGPNASGKTTTARAIESLLWPRAATAARAQLSARFTLHDTPWSVELDAGYVRWQRDGAEANAPALPPAEGRDRYRLSLHELLVTENEGLAAEILRESAGGYDLSAAAKALDCRTTTSRCTKEVEELRKARAHLEEARARQESIRADEDRLKTLIDRAEAAEAAGQRVRLFERAIEHARAVAEEHAARAALDAFPKGMKDLLGDEAERLASIGRKLADSRDRVAEAERDRREAVEALTAAGLPEPGPGDDLLSTLRARLQLLRELGQEARTRAQELASAVAQREEAARAIGDAVDQARLADLDPVKLDALADFAKRSGELEAAREGAIATIHWLGDAAAPDDLDRLELGADLLRRWLRSGTEPRDRDRRLRLLGAVAAGSLAAIGVVGLAGIVMGLPVVGWALVALLGTALLVPILGHGTGQNPAALYRKEFERLGLDRPRDWTGDDITTYLDRLEREIARGQLATEYARRRAEIERRRAELDEETERLEARRAELAASLGVAPGTGSASLYWIANRISRWQDARDRAEGIAAALETARHRAAEELAAATAALAPFGYTGIRDAAALEGAITDLERRRHRAAQATAAVRDADRRIETAAAEIHALQAERRSILERLGLDANDATAEATVAEWCGRLPEYRAADERAKAAAGARSQAMARLAETPGYTPDLATRSIDALEDERAAASKAAEEHTPLIKEITEIQAGIRAAKEGHDVEDALAEVERCREALRAARERDILGMVGSALITYVQQATRDRHRPEVFHRARQLFASITHGRYRLDFDDAEPPAFRATDTTTGFGHALDELSSGTRVQLLMAVRLAFVESQESGAMLPLVFDETLGNSDDARAEAIMEAIAALAAEGRQVFYFTAQPDEVGKWRAVLERHPGVAAKFVDLAAVRKLARYRETPLVPVSSASRPVVPVPDGASHEEYGHRLRVPPLDPGMEIGGVHLWYLVDDVDALYHLLRLGIETWGAFRTLVEFDGARYLGRWAGLYERVEPMARALEAALRLAQVGRGRRVDRSVLIESGAISNVFLDRVAKLCERCDGDAGRLLEALESRAVKGFRNDAREKLRDYLEEHGYLDPREPVGPDKIRMAAIAAVMKEIDEGRLAPSAVDRLLDRLLHPVTT